MTDATASDAPTEARASTRCWVCGSTDTRPWRAGLRADELSSDDLCITDTRYGTTLSLDRCGDCGFRFASSPSLDQLGALYENLEDPAYEGSQEGRRLQMRSLVGRARQAVPTAVTALDVGAASGLLVAEANRAGLAAVGIEPSRSLARLAQEQNGADVVCGVLPHPQFERRHFDVVFLVDVIEHVVDPLTLLRCCMDRMAEGGSLVLVTPDMSGLAAGLLGSRCWHYRLAHVGYFDRRSLEAAFERVGLEAIGWHRPVWFFPLEYLAARLEVYLPIAWLNRLALRIPPLEWLYRRVVRLRIPDSYVVVAKRAEPSE